MITLDDFDVDKIKDAWNHYQDHKQELRAEQKTEMSRHKVKYFFLSLGFTAIGFLLLCIGLNGPTLFDSVLKQYIDIVVAIIFIAVGIYSTGVYLWMMIRPEKEALITDEK